MAIELPPVGEIETIRDLLHGEIAAGNNEFMAKLSLDQRRWLIQFTAVGEDIVVDAFFDQLLARASQSQWTTRRIATFVKPAITQLKQRAKQMIERDRDAELKLEEQIDNAVNLNTQGSKKGASAHAAETAMSPQLMVDSNSPRLIAIGVLLMYRTGRLWHDEFHHAHRVDWNGTADARRIDPIHVTDAIENNIITWLQSVHPKLGHAAVSEMRYAIDYVAHRDVRNEPLDRIKALKWDGTSRLHQLYAKGFGTTDTEFTCETGRCLLIASIARLVRPGAQVDTVWVHVGAEGTLKNSALQTLFFDDFYAEPTSGVGDRDLLMEMHGKMAVHWAELDNIRGRAGTKIKAFVTRRIDRYRAPYGRKVEDHGRVSVLLATTNEEEWFADLGPGRRWYVLRCGAVDLAWLRDNLEQLWAEAYHDYMLGTDDPLGQWWNVPEDAQRALVDASRLEMEFVSQLQRYIDSLEGRYYDGKLPTGALASTEVRVPGQGGRDEVRIAWGTLITTERLAVQGMGFTPEMIGRGTNFNKIGAAMRYLGWLSDRRRVRDSDLTVRFWVKVRRADVDVARAPAPEPEDERGSF